MTASSPHPPLLLSLAKTLLTNLKFTKKKTKIYNHHYYYRRFNQILELVASLTRVTAHLKKSFMYSFSFQSRKKIDFYEQCCQHSLTTISAC